MSTEQAVMLYNSILQDLSKQKDGQRRIDLMADILREIGAELLRLQPADLAAYTGRPSAHIHAELLEKHLLQAPLSIDRLSRMRLKGAERFRLLLEANGGAYSAGEMAQVLGISQEAVKKREQRGQLLAIKQGRDLCFPVFQLAAHKNEPVPGLDLVLAAMPQTDPSEIVLFLLRPALDKKAPIDFLREGNIDAAIRLAKSHLEHTAA